MTTRECLRKLNDIKEIVARCSLEFEAIKSPHEIYEEKAAAVRASLAQAWDRLLANPHSPEASGLQREIEDHGGQLKELEITYNATFKEDEKAYDQQLHAAMESLCDDLIGTIGWSQVEKSLRTLPNQQPSESGHGGSSDGLETSLTTPSEATQREVRTSRLHISAPRTGSVIRVCPEKRKESPSGLSTRQKRHRADRTEPHREVMKTIHFEEVFQNGSAATKHVIVRFPADDGAWYILRCDKHGLTFKDKAIKSATAHLAGGEHGRLSKEPAEVIEQLGVQVLDCNETLADKNNTIALKALRREHEQGAAHNRPLREKISPSHRPTRQSRRRHHGDSSRQRDQDFNGIIDPRPGDVYLAFWEKSKEWLAVLLLPLTELENIGVRNTLQDLGLAEDVPGCYDYDNQTNCFRWREGYRDGEISIREREFPVMYFDGQDFPAKSAVGWVAAKDLRTLDINAAQSSLVPHFQSMRKFLRDRAAPQQAEVIVASSGVDRTDSFNEQHAHPRPSPDPNQDDHEAAHPAELAPCTAQSRSTTSAPDGQTSLPGGMRELEQSPEPLQEIPRNDHSDTQCEINPVNGTQMEEHPGQILSVTRPETSARTNQAIDGFEHATSTSERDSLAAKEGAGDRVNSAAIISSRVSHQVSALAQAALDTLRSPAPVRDSRSTPLISDDHCEAEPSALSGSTENPRNQGAEPVACRIMDEQPQDHAQHSPIPNLQLILQGLSSGYSSTLSEGPASNRAPLQPLPALPPTRPLNRGHISTDSTRVLSMSQPPPNACALPPILPPRGQDTTFHAMSTHQWSNSATISQLANPNAASSPLLGTVSLPVGQDCLSTGQGRAAVHASASAPSRFNEVRPNNSGLEKATPLCAPMHPALQILSESESLDLNHWAYKLPGPLVDYLKEYLGRRGLVPEFNGLRNSEGFYNCPLCDKGKVKNYQRPGSFTNHLVKHWRSVQNSSEVRLSE
ncbi:hypothetical protein B0J15DRAFT_501038 [Fusarium solani]|uniref:Uncharacterized protein n=1 Tax=Fusarium solani TaxID=169388 RepID=A0A9P9GQP4_FUSSL|nr:uncharacterized protein B0J15DRAFT_501038 [Fusarium solani]KAH7243745.1 hypothetical protein B0J15DRAFT_501038 [Fusarium solani]